MRTRVSTKLYEKGAVSCVPLGRSRFKSLAKDYRYFTSIVDAFSSFLGCSVFFHECTNKEASFEASEQISLDDLITTKLGYGISTTIYRRNDSNASVYLKSPHTKDQCHSK